MSAAEAAIRQARANDASRKQLSGKGSQKRGDDDVNDDACDGNVDDDGT